MADDERKLTRRRFMEYSAMTTAATATWYSVAMKTDAQAQAQQIAGVTFSATSSSGASPYGYAV